MTAETDLRTLVVELRKLMALQDSVDYQLGCSFAAFDPEIEAMAAQLRPQVSETASMLFDFLDVVERHPKFVEFRKKYLSELYREM